MPTQSPEGSAETLRLPVAGMSCQACAHSIERALLAVPGVLSAEVSFGARTAVVQRERGRAGAAELASAVRAAGYELPADVESGARSLARDLALADAAEVRERRLTARRLAIAAVLGPLAWMAEHDGWPIASVLALAGAVLIAAGGAVLLSGARAAWRRAPDMNTLIALGAMAAYAGALLGALDPQRFGAAGGHLHASVLIIGIALLGRWLESRARAASSGAVRALLALAPDRVRVLRRGVEQELPLSELRPGNLVLVRPGERIPVDGELLDGVSEIDESMLSGESEPVRCAPGDRLHAGTRNGLGALQIKATGIGADSALGRIAALVHAAQATRAPVQRLADRISAVFVPVVLGLALVTGIAWYSAQGSWSAALTHAVSVLVVACPCALGLATPAAIVAAVGAGARRGLLVRDAASLEALARVDTLVLDKTGTLTLGRPALIGAELVEGAGELDREGVLALAAAVEQSSEQPLARALVEAAQRAGLELPRCEEFRAEPGRGVHGRVNGRQIFVGRLDEPALGAAPGTLHALAERFAAAGATPVVVRIDGKDAAVLALRDELRGGAAETVRELQRSGLRLVLCSGDHAGAVARVARELGIDEFHARETPERKLERVRALRRAGRRVAVIGDGLNDAPALAEADAGIALAGGTEAAQQAAGCVVVAADAGRWVELLALARNTLGVIRQNLVWAFGYNLLALPLAAGLLEPFGGWSPSPGVAAAAMAGSSLAVVLNSARLRWSRARHRLQPRAG